MDISELSAPGFERLVRMRDAASGLTGFIAVHSTQLGPAAGGLRMRPYRDQAEAIDDVLRLARGMTFKNAAAGLPLGGGKAVIIGDPATGKSPELLRAVGGAVDSLGGRYWTAEDMGMTPADMAFIGQVTEFVAGLPDGPSASGDPSPVTAQGIFNAIRQVARHRFGDGELGGRHVAVQGLGHVGTHLCTLLDAAGARLSVADTDPGLVRRAIARFGATSVDAAAILRVEAEILAPCAIGGILNRDTIPRLRVAAVAGGANNQLATPADGRLLHERGILYAPDFIANAGGIINVATEILRIPDPAAWVTDKLTALDRTLDRILTRAASLDTSPADVAERIVGELLQSRAA